MSTAAGVFLLTPATSLFDCLILYPCDETGLIFFPYSCPLKGLPPLLSVPHMILGVFDSCLKFSTASSPHSLASSLKETGFPRCFTSSFLPQPSSWQRGKAIHELGFLYHLLQAAHASRVLAARSLSLVKDHLPLTVLSLSPRPQSHGDQLRPHCILKSCLKRPSWLCGWPASPLEAISRGHSLPFQP